MKILVHDYAGHPFQVQLSRELARRGHEVRHAYAGALQTPRGELRRRTDDPATFSVGEVAMDPDYAKHKYSFAKRRGMEVRYGREVATLIRQWKPEAVLSSNTPTETQEPILNAARAGGSRFLFWVQDFYSLAVDKLVRKKIPVVGGAIGGYYKYLERRQLRRSDHVITITDDFNPLLVSSFGVPESKVTAIPNWAPLDSLPVETKANGWAQAHDLADKFVFLYTGTLGMKHNPALLRDLAKSMRPHPKARVVVISEGLGADWLMAEKSAAGGGLDNLMVMPYQPFESLPQVLGAGDCLIAVLEEDAGIFSVPSKVLTYLCAGKPLLLACPQVNLAARIVRENEAGLVVAPSDLRGFLDNAAKIYGDIKLSEKFGENSRNYAESTFNICDIALKFENVIKN